VGLADDGASVAAAAAFVLFERRLAARGGHPLIHRRVLTSPGLAVSAGSMLLLLAGVSGFLFSFTLYLQGALGESPLRAGLTFAPMAAGFGVAGLLWRRLPARWPQLPAGHRVGGVCRWVRRAGRLGAVRPGHPARPGGRCWS